MAQEITEVDIKKIKEELEYRKYTLRPQLHEEVKRTREYGDLSENDEYRCAKRERNRNESRIRYLDRFLLTAKVVKANEHRVGIGLFDIVEFLNERTGATKRMPCAALSARNRRLGAPLSGAKQESAPR